MNPWRTRWRRAQRYGWGQAWRAGIAYRMHDALLTGRTPAAWPGRLLGFGQRPTFLPTAQPGITEGWDLEELASGHVVHAPAARAWMDDGTGLVDLPLPDMPPASTLGVRRLIVRDATIQPGQSLIVTPEAALVPEFIDRVPLGDGLWEPGPDTCISPWRKRGESYALSGEAEQRMQEGTATLWRSTDAVESLPVAISLFETVDDHFGHAMLDLLHRLRAVLDLPVGWPVLVSDRMPDNVVAWIEVICPGRKVIRCAHDRVIRVSELMVPLEAARLWQFPHIDADEPVPATIDPEGMQWLQQIADTPERPRHRRLWIRRDRSPHCAIRGEAELVELARLRGFEDVFLQDLNLKETRELLAVTSHVIAPMASAVTNLVLARPGLRVLQLTDQVTAVDRYGSLTWLPHIGHEAGLVVGRSSDEGYRVSEDALKAGMDWLLADLG